MLSPSEFNNAVPKFTNGNYANNPVDPQYIEEPTLQDYNRGVEPLETLPAQWWNWLCNQFTSRFNKINTYVKNIFDEITQLLSLLNISPDGTESAITTGQLKNFFKELYPSYVSDKLELGTTYVPQTRTVNGHALSGNISITKSDVGLGNVDNTSDIDKPVSTAQAEAINNAIISATDYDFSYYTSGEETIFIIETPYDNNSNYTLQGEIIITARYGISYKLSFYNFIIESSLSTSAPYAGKVTLFEGNDASYLLPVLKWDVDTTNKKVKYYLKKNSYNTKVTFKVLQKSNHNAQINFSTSTDADIWNNATYSKDFNNLEITGTLIEGSNKLVTSKAVTDVLSNLPSDAVLHYSFDEVPDLPDGTAVYRKNNNFTDTIGWSGNATAIVSNGKITISGSADTRKSYDIQMSAGLIICIKGVANKSSNLYLTVRHQGATSDTTIKNFNVESRKPFEVYGIIDAQSIYFNFYCGNTDWDITISQIYIGDGSYTTPIIDNTNGQWNATNNGTVSVSGVSGKGALFLQNSFVVTRYVDFLKSSAWSLSFWVNLKRGTVQNPRLYRFGNGEYCFANNFSTTGNIFTFYTFQDSSRNISLSLDLSSYFGTMIHITVITEIVLGGSSSKTIYINGVKKGMSSGTITQVPSTTEGFIGGTGDNNSIDNSIFDDFQIFNRVLSQEEVTALYFNKANTPKYYDLDDYKLANGDTAPTANSNNFVDSKTLYNFFGGNTSANSWLGKVFGWALGKNWTQATGFSTTPTILCIHHANGIWIAGSIGIYWSTDGITWTQVTGSISNKYIETIYYANGVWVAGTISNGAWWSTDGITWTQGTGSNTNRTITCIYYANNIWVAGSHNRGFWWSTDGKSWTQGSNTSSYGYDVYYGNNIWVFSCGDGLWWSTDGKNWTKGTTNVQGTVDPRVVYFANGEWKAGYSSGILKSTDGKDWVTEIGTGNFIDIYYANGTWVGVSTNVGVWFQKNNNWKQTDITFNSISVYYANNTWVINTQNRGFWWSSDGETWMPSNISNYTEGQSTSNKHKTVFYGNGIWVAAGYNRAGLWWSSYENAGLE